MVVVGVGVLRLMLVYMLLLLMLLLLLLLLLIKGRALPRLLSRSPGPSGILDREGQQAAREASGRSACRGRRERRVDTCEGELLPCGSTWSKNQS